MSLKQRAVQCSGHIPDSHYVPVYSRPYWTNQTRRHEEIAPITPKPSFDDPYNTDRTQSIHLAVKQWLESSPNSVIGPLYSTRSPSSGSPPSLGESIEQKIDTPPWESSNNDQFCDVASGPKQVSIEQSTALATGSSASSPRPAADQPKSSPSDHTYPNGAQDSAVEPAALPPMQTSLKSPEHVLPKEGDGRSARANDDGSPSSIPQERFAADQILSEDEGIFSEDEELWAQAEEGKFNPSPRREAKKRPITELKSPEQDRSYGLSGGSLSEYNSRAASREFDNALALVVKEIDKESPNDTLSCASFNSSVGTPKVHLKPPRGLEKHVPHGTELQSLAVVSLPPLPRAPSSREFQNSVALTLALPRATSFKADQSSHATCSPALIHHATSTTEDTTRVAGGANNSAEIVPASPEIVGNRFGDKKNVNDGNETPLSASEQQELELGSRMTLKDALLIEKKLSAEQKARLSATPNAQKPVVAPGVVASDCGGFDLKREPSSRRSRSSYSPGGSVASLPNSVPQQYIYKVSPLHQMARKGLRSKKQNAVAPAEAEALKRDRSTRSSKSIEREASPAKLALVKAKLEELQLKADAWEAAKNATILNRYNQEESKIHAWEEHKVAKATMALSKMESDLEKKKAKAAEKMKNEVEQTHKKAAEMKAQAESKRAERVAKAAVQAQVLRALGKSPLSCFRS